ncbi:uncharacterized protein [Prorops nasuta]|uniref:uncharacterized protein isoform X2 n=1 Tax=Prorops nasuta TaxID=863751 RepID=UPI0034CF8B61
MSLPLKVLQKTPGACDRSIFTSANCLFSVRQKTYRSNSYGACQFPITFLTSLRKFHTDRNLNLPANDSSTLATLTKQQAKELVQKLTLDERKILSTAISECKSQEDKAGYEGQLAALRWRSKFGRPSKVPSLGDVDPTGSYCTVPDDWLVRKYEPTTKDLILVTVSNAIPFIGFGFLDNFIMIVAGDQIEMIISVRFPITTMVAAALGNTVSDIIGIGSVHYVERFAQKVGFQAPQLTPIQLDMPKSRFAANMGRVIGVTIGCLLGMTPIPLMALFHSS